MTCLPLAVALSILIGDGTPPCHRTPANAIPAASYVGIEFAGLDACREASGSLGIAALLETVAAPARRELMRELGDEWQHVEQVLGDLELDRASLRALVQKPLAVGVSRVTLFGHSLLPSIAVAIDADGRERTLIPTVQKALRNLVRSQKLALKESTVDGAKVWTLTHRTANGRIAAVFAEDLILLSNSPRYARECLQAWQGDRKSLAGVDARERGRDTLDGNVLLSAVVNLDAVSGLLPYEVDEVTDVLGVRPGDRLFLGTSVDGKVSRELVHVHTRRTPRGLAAAVLPEKVRGRAARYCPEDTLVYTAGRIDAKALRKAAGDLMAALPTEAGRELERELGREIAREMQRELGMDLSHMPVEFERLFAALGKSEGEWTLAAPAPSLSKPIPHGLMVLEFEDAENLAAAVQGTLGASERMKHVEFRGTTLHYVSISNGIRLSPSFCVHDGVLVAASDLRVLKSALVRRIEGKPSLADRDFSTRIAGQKPALFASIRIREAIETYWPFVYGLASSAPEDVEGIDLDAVPEADEMLESMADLKIGVVRHKRGIDVLSESPVGLGAIFAVLVGTMDEFLSPKLN